MGQVNLITKSKADAIASSYLENKNVQSLYVTRDGQVFYPENKSYMKMHEKANKLDLSWFYSKDKKEVLKPEKAQKEVVEPKQEPNLSFAALKKYFQDLTVKGKIELSDWNNLKFAQLREKYEEINK